MSCVILLRIGNEYMARMVYSVMAMTARHISMHVILLRMGVCMLTCAYWESTPASGLAVNATVVQHTYTIPRMML